MAKKLTYQFVKERFEKEGYNLLTTEYKNNKQKLEYVCPKGHNHKITFHNWIVNNNRCPYCVGLGIPDFDGIKKSFKNEGYTLLSKAYKNTHSKLNYICSNGHERSIAWSDWQSGRRCKVCASVGKNCNWWKGGVKKLNLPLYNTYAHKIAFAEEVRPFYDKENRKLLEVRCSKCDKWFIPKAKSIDHRIDALNGKVGGENRLYCSQKCKDNCEVFKKRTTGYLNLTQKEYSYTQEELQIWSQEVLKRADLKCEICGESAEHAHHIQPRKLEPGLALDPENGIALCRDCHYKYGHSDECSTGKLANTICK